MTTIPESLEDQLDLARRTISTDSYPMSIGELTSMFKEGELIIRPAFQRLFRWDSSQKSKLIESILLGIPIPSIFVSQDDEGRWEIVDGLQRMSTLLQLQGLLDSEKYDPLKLEATRYLPDLEGRYWSDEFGELSLTPAQQRDIKRSKLDVKIIKRESDSQTKYELFQRLNSLGSALTGQEIRNAVLVGINTGFADWVHDLAANEDFVATTRLSDSDLEKKYDEELVLRFLWLYALPDRDAASIRKFQESLEDFAISSAREFPEGAHRRKEVFDETFRLLSEAPDIFRKWNLQKQAFSGGFLNTAFEVMGLGLGHLISIDAPYRTDFEDAARELWAQADMAGNFATGRSTENRLSITLPKGRELLRNVE